jgi:putative transposase
MNNPFRYFDS